MQSDSYNSGLQTISVRMGEALDNLVSKKNAALQLGIHYRTIERWYNQGMLDRYRIGGRFYFDKRAIQMLATSPEPRVESKSSRFQIYLETLRK